MIEQPVRSNGVIRPARRVPAHSSANPIGTRSAGSPQTTSSESSPRGLIATAVRRAREGVERPRPLVQSRVPAGFPSPADDHVEVSLDLSRELVGKEEATFFVRVAGDSMTGAGIHDEDILVVDRSVKPEDGVDRGRGSRRRAHRGSGTRSSRGTRT